MDEVTAKAVVVGAEPPGRRALHLDRGRRGPCRPQWTDTPARHPGRQWYLPARGVARPSRRAVGGRHLGPVPRRPHRACAALGRHEVRCTPQGRRNGRLAGLAWAGGLELQIVTPHPAAAGLELGASAEAALRALTGRDPTGWGIAGTGDAAVVPAGGHILLPGPGPTPTSLVIVGGEPWPTVVGVLTVERVDSGVREQIRLAGPPLVAVSEATIETLAEEVADSVRSMIVTVHPGRSGGLRSSTPSLPALPYGILVGSRGGPRRRPGVPDDRPRRPVVPARHVGPGTRRTRC